MLIKTACLTLLPIAIGLLACGLSGLPFAGSGPEPTPTLAVAHFITPAPTSIPSPGPAPTVVPIETATSTPTQISTPEPTPGPGLSPTVVVTPAISPPSPTLPPEPPPTLPPEPSPAPSIDFVLRYVRMRTNEENSWDGTIDPGYCGNDHSIYVHVADAQENLLDGILVGDKYGNFEVPAGVDGPGAVRILVWSATMEVAVTGHQDGARYTSDFTPPLSTLDEHIPLDWLRQAGYCQSPEDCQQRVENNQLCRGHYSYDVIFQRTW